MARVTQQERAVMGMVRDAMAAYVRGKGHGIHLHEMNRELRRALDYFTALEYRQEIAAEKRDKATR